MKIKMDNEKLWLMIAQLVNAEHNYAYAEGNSSDADRIKSAGKAVDEERRKLRAILLLPRED